MAQLIFFSFLILSLQVKALSLEYLAEATLSNQTIFEKTKIGGLSSLYYSEEEKELYALSNDQGTFNKPRFYKFSLSLKKGEMKLEPKAIYFLKSRDPKTLKLSLSNLQAMAPLPWGNFLISSFGNNNGKPRIVPQILDVKPNGEVVREFPIPNNFIPEKSGWQNNAGFKGLAAGPSKSFLIAAMAKPLAQDLKVADQFKDPNLGQAGWVRFLRYEMPEAWVIRSTREYKYPLDATMEGGGVSQVLLLDEHRMLVMERSVLTSAKTDLEFQVRIFLVDLSLAGKTPVLQKTLVLDLVRALSQMKSPQKVENYEGMTLGPSLEGGQKTLLLVSDDNFVRKQRTHFVAFAIKD